MKYQNKNTFRITLIYFAILFLGIICVPTAHAEYSLAGPWGSNSTGPVQFKLPGAIAVDLSGNVYVADYGNNSIDKFYSNGTLITEWNFQSTNDIELGASGIMVYSSDNVYVVTETSGQPTIEKYAANYALAGTWGLGPNFEKIDYYENQSLS
jgi:DNA-binding beta-propeller fold protein YncE